MNNDGTQTQKLPSIKQMLNRMNEAHYAILSGKATLNVAIGESAMIARVRGYRTALRTLYRWGCLDNNGNLTDRGTELLAASN